MGLARVRQEPGMVASLGGRVGHAVDKVPRWRKRHRLSTWQSLILDEGYVEASSWSFFPYSLA